MDGLQHVGTRLVEDLVAAFQAAEVVEREIGGLQLGAHRAVADHHTLRQSVEDIGVVAVFVRGSHRHKDSWPMEIASPRAVTARRRLIL